MIKKILDFQTEIKVAFIFPDSSSEWNFILKPC